MTFLLSADDCQRFKYASHHYHLEHYFTLKKLQCAYTFLRWEASNYFCSSLCSSPWGFGEGSVLQRAEPGLQMGVEC